MHRMISWFVNSLGYADLPALVASTHAVGILAIMSFAESSFFPIPPDFLMIAMAVATPENGLYFALVCSIASVLGGALGYLIGLKGGRPLLEYLETKSWGRKLFSPSKVARVEKLYEKYDVWAVVIAGFTPVPYKLFTITSGVFRMPFLRFILASAVSRSARFFIVGGAFYFYGETVKVYIEKYLGAVSIAVVVLALLGWWVVKIMKRKKCVSHCDESTEDNVQACFVKTDE